MAQFKFGDFVLCKSNQTAGIVVGLDEANNAASIFIDGLAIPRYVNIDSLELIPHPDTARLDFIERVINVDGMVKRKMRKGWVLVDEDGIELAPHKPLLRDAIDAVMRASEYLSK